MARELEGYISETEDMLERHHMTVSDIATNRTLTAVAYALDRGPANGFVQVGDVIINLAQVRLIRVTWNEGGKPAMAVVNYDGEHFTEIVGMAEVDLLLDVVLGRA